MRESEHQLPSESAGNPAESAGTGAGKDEASGKLKCPACGFLNEPDAESCARCGQRFKAREPSELASPWGEVPSRAEPDERTPTGGGQEPVGRKTPSQEPERRLTAPPEAAAEPTLREPSGEAHQPAEEPAEPPSEESVRYSFVPSASGTPTGVRVVPASLGRRSMALVIDFIVIMILLNLLVALTGLEATVADYQARVLSSGQGILGIASQESQLGVSMTCLAIFFFILVVGYFGIFSGYGGQTPGKAVLGIKLLYRDGREVGLWVAILRALLMWLAVQFTMGLYLILAAMTIFLDSESRAIHDFFFNTNVYHVPRT